MQKLVSKIKKIADKIRIEENKRELLAKILRDTKSANLIKKIKPAEINDLKIAAVDGGLIKKSLHGFDCILVRAAAVLFHYKDNKISSVKYFPGKIPTPMPILSETFSNIDWIHFSSIIREKTEIKTAIDCIEYLKPNVLLLDGSIVPYYLDKPAKSSPIYKHYVELVELYKELYKKVLAKGIILAGVIEDSKAVSFCKFIKENILDMINIKNVSGFKELLSKTRDTNLLSLILKKGEMSRVFKYAKSESEHIILQDFNQYAAAIFSFYLKTAELDRPIRVDFLNNQNAEKLGEILLSISGQHPEYGIPAPLIEADNVAKLSENDFEDFYSKLISMLGNLSCLKKLRREQRPF